MRGSNSLNKWWPTRHVTSPVNKMNGGDYSKWMVGKSKRFLKKFFSKKRRQLLKNFGIDKI